MQHKNLIIFCLLSFVILLGWIPLQNLIWPLKEKPRPVWVWKDLSADDQVLMFARLSAAPMSASPGLHDAYRLLSEAETVHWGPRELHRLAALATEKPPVKKPAAVEAPPPVRRSAAPHREIQLGNEEFNIQTTVTSRGGGIQTLSLNRFKEASWMGKPTGQKLHLIPDQRFYFWNDEAPSNLIYHYAPPVEGHPDNPVDTLGNMEWTVGSVTNGPDDKVHRVVLTATIPVESPGNPGQEIHITRTYTLESETYHLGLELQFKLSGPPGKGPVDFRYQLSAAHGLPIEGEWYTSIYRNALIGGFDEQGSNVWRDLQDARQIGVQGGGRYLPRTEKEGKFIRFAGVASQFFTSLVIVDDEQKKKNFIEWARPTVESEWPDPKKRFLDDITVRLVSERIELTPDEPVVHKYLLYNGPVKVRLLSQLEGAKKVPPELVERYEKTLHLNQLTDYGKFGIWTDLLIVCTNVMHQLLWFLHMFMPWSYGLSIVMLTLLVRSMMFPLSRKQAISSAKMQARMAELAPEFKQLEAKFKGDTLGLHQAKQELMVKRGINPMAMLGSCWIIFLQMPIFLGLYYALQESIHFRLAPFLWIDNLAAPDMLIEWGEKIPWISRFEDQGSMVYLGPFFNLLPLIWVALQIIQQQMMMLPPTDEQQAMQQKMMKYMMVFIGVMFYKVAAGLCIYFIASGLWTIAERKLLPKPAKPGGTPPGDKAPLSGKNPGGGGRPKPRGGPNGDDGALQKVRAWWDKVLKEAKKK